MSDRYEPLPGFVELPGWLWRRTSRAARVAAGLAVAGLAVLAVIFVPQISESNRERAQARERERVAARAALVRRLEAEQRPRYARAAGPGRAAVFDALRASILADARGRVRAGALAGPIERVDCGPFPRTDAPAHEDASRRRGRYACTAVTASGTGSVLGHPYRARVDFATGRYAFCKTAGAPGPEREPLVRIPPACGGTR